MSCDVINCCECLGNFQVFFGPRQTASRVSDACFLLRQIGTVAPLHQPPAHRATITMGTTNALA